MTSPKEPIPKKKPICSSIGLTIMLVSVVWGYITLNESIDSNAEFGGFAGFAVLAVFFITFPASLILGIVSTIRKETPKFLALLLFTTTLAPILIYVYRLAT